MTPRSKRGYGLAALVLAVLGLAVPARAQVGGGAPIAYLYCYSGTVPTSPISWTPCSAANPLVVSATITPSGIQSVKIDQTTPGTTNGVIVNNPLSTGLAGTPASDTVSTQPVNLTATGNITTQNLNPNSGTATAGSTVALNVYGQSSCRVQVTGTYSGSLSGQDTVDGINWVTWLSTSAFTKKSSGLLSATIASAAVDTFNFFTQGATQVRITALGAQTGTAVVTINCSQASIRDYEIAQGLTADASAASGNPVQVGGVVYTAAGSAVSNSSNARLPMTAARQLITKDFSPSETQWSYAATTGGISNTTTAVTIQAAGAANVRNFITACQLSADPLGAATEFAIRDGAAGTVLWRTKIGTAGLVGGENIIFPSPLKGTAATLVEVVTLTASVSGGVFVDCQGYQAQGG